VQGFQLVLSLVRAPLKIKQEKQQRLMRIRQVEEKQQRLMRIRQVEEKQQRLMRIRQVEEKQQRPMRIRQVEEKQQRPMRIRQVEEKQQRLMRIRQVEEKQQRLMRIRQVVSHAIQSEPSPLEASRSTSNPPSEPLLSMLSLMISFCVLFLWSCLSFLLHGSVGQ